MTFLVLCWQHRLPQSPRPLQRWQRTHEPRSESSTKSNNKKDFSQHISLDPGFLN